MIHYIHSQLTSPRQGYWPVVMANSQWNRIKPPGQPCLLHLPPSVKVEKTQHINAVYLYANQADTVQVWWDHWGCVGMQDTHTACVITPPQNTNQYLAGNLDSLFSQIFTADGTVSVFLRAIQPWSSTLYSLTLWQPRIQAAVTRACVCVCVTGLPGKIMECV